MGFSYDLVRILEFFPSVIIFPSYLDGVWKNVMDLSIPMGFKDSYNVKLHLESPWIGTDYSTAVMLYQQWLAQRTLSGTDPVAEGVRDVWMMCLLSSARDFFFA